MSETGKWVDTLPAEPPHLFVCDGEEWSALYVDGELDKVGDTYLIDERLRYLAGVVTISTMDFLRGGGTRSDVAQNYEELKEYRHARLDRQRRAKDLRTQAAALQQEADELDKSR